MPRLIRGLIALSLILLTSCTSPVADETPAPTPSLRLYRTPTPTFTPRVPSPTVAPIATPIPTPTPLSHRVQQGETLLEIAARYGVTLDALLVANPGINPRQLSIGQEIIVPQPELSEVQTFPPTPTPVPLRLSDVRCYRTLSNALWCLTLVTNTTDVSIGGISVVITLTDTRGQPLRTGTADVPLAILLPGQEMPAAAYFEPPAPDAARADVALVSALTEANTGSRQVAVVILGASHTPGSDRHSWKVEGKVTLTPDADSSAASVTVVLIAYDVNDEIAGFSTRELEQGLEPGEEASFEMLVFSLGPAIDHVQMIVEGLAATPTSD